MDKEHIQVVIFTLGDEEFAFDINYVKEVIRVLDITKVPKSKEMIEGVINLRGNVIPVIDLRKRFNLSAVILPRTTRIIILEINQITVGFIVDTVLGTRQIKTSCIEATPAAIMGKIEYEYIAGVAKLEYRLLNLLHIEKIISIKN